MTQDFQFLKRLYNAFDPFRRLPAGDPAYVNCNNVWGDDDILVGVGREILMSDRICFIQIRKVTGSNTILR